ncbi:MAG: class II aldolase/adducin family protein [Syntrophaceae bacterium]|nr:class II aldolase/adducin family protein [Syntrophaceae bacterium]
MVKKKRDKLSKYKNDLARFSRLSYERGLVAARGGNLSIRIPETERVLITPSGISLRDITPEIIIEVDIEGNLLKGKKDLKPSKETPFHTSIYRLRGDVMAIAHLHPPFATALSLKDKPLPILTAPGMVNLAKVPLVQFAFMGTKELCDYVTETVKESMEAKAYLLKGHGIIAVGPDLESAYYIADLVEDCAKVAFLHSVNG